MPSASWNPDLATIVEEAFERAGMEGRSGYEYRSAIRSMNLLFTEWANMGLNLWTLEQQTLPLLSGVQTYALPNDTVDIIDLAINYQNNDYRIERIGVSSWAGISNKLTTGRPTIYYIERTVPAKAIFWPIPNATGYAAKYWRLRRIYDAGSADDAADVPFRFLPPLCAGLAVKLAIKNKMLDPTRLQVLEADYQRVMMDAMDEDRGREPFYIKPSIS